MLQTEQVSNDEHNPLQWRTDDEGFLLDPNDWQREFTRINALQDGLQINDKHWQLIDVIRGKFLGLGSLPPMRAICREAGYMQNEVRLQFGTCLTLWRMAGLPNPGEEARAYMN